MADKLSEWTIYELPQSMPYSQVSYRRVGDALEVQAYQDQPKGGFRELELLLDRGLNLDVSRLAPGARTQAELTIWEIEVRVEVPLFRTWREKVFRILTFRPLYREELQRRETIWDESGEPEVALNPRFVCRKLYLTVPVNP